MKELREVLRNRNLVILLTGRLISSGGDYLYFVALSVAVFHYSQGNTTFVGLFWVTRLIPSLVLGPFAGALADRVGYRSAMITADLGRMVVVLLLALVLTSTTWALIFPLAFLVQALSSFFRPASVGLIPSLVRSKEERLTANAAILEVNSIAMIGGSALGGVLAGLGLTKQLLIIEALTFGVSAASVFFIRPPQRGATEPETQPVVSHEAPSPNFLQRLRSLVDRPVLTFSASAMVLPELASGAIAVWIVPYSIQSLHLGNAGVGYLYCSLGIGSAVGGILAAMLASSIRLEDLLAWGVIAGGVSLALFGFVSVAIVALFLVALLGVCETVEFAAYQTLVQQAVPANRIGEASGTMDSLFFNMMLIGNVISGLLAQSLGLNVSMVGLGVLIVVVASLAWINFRAKTARQPDAAFLDRIPAFANVSEDVREWATRQMVRREYPPGDVIVRQGDRGDDFYTIAKGKVRVDVGSNGQAATRELGPGDFFGEIALLQDVPRTATVTALEPVTTYTLSREAFQELQRRAGEFKESLLQTAASRLQEDTNLKMSLASLS